jgi:pyruvate kinase
MVWAGMSVARLNFSHGSHEDHARAVAHLRAVAAELDTPVTILQDLQGSKVRVGQLPGGQVTLVRDGTLTLVPEHVYDGQADHVPIDYPHLAAEARPGAPVLLDDGLIELRVEEVAAPAVRCRVIEGGELKSRKGVVLPTVELGLPSLTEKDRRDLEFGIGQGVDWVALSFVRRADDVRALKAFLAERAAPVPVLAKIEKPQAVQNLDEILEEVQGLMVARGDLGVEVSPEQVPLLQKRIIRACNGRGVPVITATQMLESMIREPRPTRAEASDVANAILDGTDAIMLSGESAVGQHPVLAVEMMARIARAVEPELQPVNHAPAKSDETHALSQAINAIDQALPLRCITAFTTQGYTARLVSAERPRAPVVALTPQARVYHALNLLWGVRPLLTGRDVTMFEELTNLAETALLRKGLALPGDRILIVAGLPMGRTGGTNLVKIHTVRGL